MSMISTSSALLALSNLYFQSGLQVTPSKYVNYKISGIEFRREIDADLQDASEKAKTIKNTDDLVKVDIKTKSNDGYTINSNVFIAGDLKFIDKQQDASSKVSCYRFLIQKAKNETFPATPIELLVLINNDKDVDSMKSIISYIDGNAKVVQGDNSSLVFGVFGDVLPPSISKELKFAPLKDSINKSCTIVTDFSSLTLRLGN